MRDVKRHDNCFDALRLVAAAMVLYAHGWSVWNTNPPTLLRGGFSFATLGVSIFFVTSGYLVTGSWLSRPNLRAFAIKRLLRILPALAPILLAVVVLRASDAFAGNPRTDIAPQLWTIPLELKCYLMVALLGVLGLMRSRVTVLGLWAIVLALALGHEYPVGDFLASGPFVTAAQMLVGLFLGGALMRWVPLRLWIALALLLVLVVWYPGSARPEWVWMLSIPYLTIYVAHLGPVRLKADASYGLYIWGFAVQQALVAAGVEPVPMFLLALPVAYGLGRLSWRYVERPALGLKARLLDRAETQATSGLSRSQATLPA